MHQSYLRAELRLSDETLLDAISVNCFCRCCCSFDLLRYYFQRSRYISTSNVSRVNSAIRDWLMASQRFWFIVSLICVPWHELKLLFCLSQKQIFYLFIYLSFRTLMSRRACSSSWQKCAEAFAASRRHELHVQSFRIWAEILLSESSSNTPDVMLQIATPAQCISYTKKCSRNFSLCRFVFFFIASCWIQTWTKRRNKLKLCGLRTSLNSAPLVSFSRPLLHCAVHRIYGPANWKI